MEDFEAILGLRQPEIFWSPYSRSLYRVAIINRYLESHTTLLSLEDHELRGGLSAETPDEMRWVQDNLPT